MNVVFDRTARLLFVRSAGAGAIVVIAWLAWLGLTAVEMSGGVGDPTPWILAAMLSSMSGVLFVVGSHELYQQDRAAARAVVRSWRTGVR